MIKKIIVVFFIFCLFSSHSYAQVGDDEIVQLILNDDEKGFREYIGHLKDTLNRIAPNDVDYESRIILDIFLAALLPSRADRPLMCQAVLDTFRLLQLSELTESIKPELFLLEGTTAGSPKVIRYFLDQGINYLEDSPFELLIDCPNIKSEEVFFAKDETYYLQTLDLLLEYGFQMAEENTFLDDFFERSECKSVAFVQKLYENGGKGSETSLARLNSMQLDEYKVYKAIQDNDYDQFMTLLKQPIDLHYSYQDTPLVELAIHYDRPRMLLNLMQIGADIEIVNPARDEKIFFQIHLDHSMELWEVICSGLSDINKPDKYGKSLLFRTTQAYQNTYDWNVYRGNSERKAHYLAVFQLLDQYQADFNQLYRGFRPPQKPFGLIDDLETSDSLNIEIYELFLERTHALEALVPGVIEGVYKLKRPDLVELLINKLQDYPGPIIEYCLSKKTSEGLPYLLQNYASKIKEKEIIQLLYHFSLRVPNIRYLSFTLDSIALKQPNLSEEERPAYARRLLNHYYPQALGDQSTLLFDILEQLKKQKHRNFEPYLDIIEYLLHKGASLKKGEKRGQNEISSSDLIDISFEKFNYLYSILHRYFIQDLILLDFNKKNKPQTNNETGERYERANIYQYETQYLKDIHKNFCTTCKVNGPPNLGYIIVDPQSKIVVDDIIDGKELPNNGRVTVDYTERRVCENRTKGLFAIGPEPLSINPVWSISPGKFVENSSITYIAYAKTSVEQLSMYCRYEFVIDKCTVNESIVNCLPIVTLTNEAEATGFVSVEQKGQVINLNPGKSITLDRTLGTIKLSFSGTQRSLNVPLNVKYNVTDIDLLKVKNRSGSSLSDRVFLYLTALRGWNDSSNSRSEVAMSRLLGEYAMEKGYKRSIKTDLDRAFDRIRATNQDILRLFRFQRSFIANQIGDQEELIALLEKARTSLKDEELIQTIDKTLDSARTNSKILIDQLALFTSGYFEQLSLDVQDFQTYLLEYSYFELVPEKVEVYKKDEFIKLIL